MSAFPRAPGAYDASDQENLRESLRRAFAGTHKKNHDVELGRGRLILTAQNGSRWLLAVSNGGAVVLTPL